MQVAHLKREEVEKDLTFVGFLVFHCPLKPDAVATLKMLSDSSHRVSILFRRMKSTVYLENLGIVHYDYWRQPVDCSPCCA